MTNIKQVIEAKAKEFARNNKIGYNKLMAFLSELPQSKAPSHSNAGRKPSCDTLQLRDNVINWLSNNKQSPFTVKQLAEKLNAQPVMVNNTLSWLKANKPEINLQVVGKAQKASNVRGRSATMFTVV